VLIVCLTVAFVAGLIAWTYRDLERSRHEARLRIVEHEHRAACLAADFADALQALLTLAPAPAIVGERVTVNTKHGDVFHGIVDAEWTDRVRLVDAHIVTGEGSRLVPGGVVSIPRADEAFRQEHGPADALTPAELNGHGPRLERLP
jgi:hypothetical protein